MIYKKLFIPIICSVVFTNLPTGEILLANPQRNDNDESSFISIYSHYLEWFRGLCLEDLHIV